MAYQVPHRKPMPQVVSPRQAQYSHLHPEHRQQHYAAPPHSPQNINTTYSHSRSRTTSSNTIPNNPGQVYQQQQLSPGLPSPNMNTYQSRRSPSTATFSTTTSSNGPIPVRDMDPNIRRSTSSRSGNSSPTSYVALMRRQKATVWSDRAQHEDPRLLAQQRQAKLRATQEVTGGQKKHYSSSNLAGGRTSTSGSGSIVGSNRVTAKIRHHGKAGLVGYSPGDIMGGVGGVPMRLSASEVEGGDSDDDSMGNGEGYGYTGSYHHRSGSGRSSLGSFSGAKRGPPPSRGSMSGNGRWSSGTTPPNEAEIVGMANLAEASPDSEDAETPLATRQNGRPKDYFAGGDGNSDPGNEKADSVGDLSASRLASNSLLPKKNLGREKSLRNPEDLRRRGSVDERTMTMTAGMGRLFIANPDADDSD